MGITITSFKLKILFLMGKYFYSVISTSICASISSIISIIKSSGKPYILRVTQATVLILFESQREKEFHRRPVLLKSLFADHPVSELVHWGGEGMLRWRMDKKWTSPSNMRMETVSNMGMETQLKSWKRHIGYKMSNDTFQDFCQVWQIFILFPCYNLWSTLVFML